MPDDDEPARGGEDSSVAPAEWPYLSELDLDVCVEPSHLPGPPHEGEDK